MQIKTTPEILQLVSSNPNKDRLLYFTYQILKRKTNKEIYLSSECLGDTFGKRKYTLLRENLVKLGILEMIPNYREMGFKYYTYKVLLPHSRKDLISYEITDEKLIKTVERILRTNLENLTPELKQVSKNIDSLVITPDLLAELKKDNIHIEDEIFFTNNKRFKLNIKQSKSTGRVSHTLTNLPKKYRKKLSSIYGNLVEIDAKNAQLIFLNQLCPEDLDFAEDAYNGVFYEKLAEKMGVDISDDSVKGKFKKKFFNSTLCNENKVVVANNKYSFAFKTLYPKVFDFFIYGKLNNTKASTLQKMESEFFITNILKDIVSKNLFVIPVHDAMIVLEKDVETVISIFEVYSNIFFERQIKIKKEAYSVCSTPFNFAPHIIKEKGGIKNKINNINKCICGANSEGIEQNKNNIKSQITIDKITTAILSIVANGEKVTTRKIKEISGVSTSSVNKHYKTILNGLKDAANKNEADVLEIQISDSKESCELKNVESELGENKILAEFLHLSENYGFPKGIEDFYVKHIIRNGFDSIEELIHEINIHPILKDLVNRGQVA